jgi:heme A synthase
MEAILGLLILGAIVGMWFALVRKAGYETGKAVLMAIGMLIPLVNLGILIYFVSTTWPIQAELASLRAKAGVGSEDDGQALMSAALRLESRGDVRAAIAKYEEVMRRFPATDFAKDAEVSIRSLREKIG